MLPLDLDPKKIKEIEGWKKNVRPTIFDFSRLIAAIQKNNNLSEIVRSGFDFDLDNIEPIISLLQKEGYMRLNKNNKYEITNLPKPNSLRVIKIGIPHFSNPNYDYNQFPCSAESRTKRVEKLVNDFPHVKSMRVGLLGDDDLTSLEMALRTNFTPVVFDIDDHVIGIINEFAHKNKLTVNTIEKDFRKLRKKDIKTSIDTFITEPPYTINGISTFLYHGLNLTKIKDRFYLIANQMFLGKSGLSTILTTLSKSGVYPIEIVPCFNDYPLPKDYRETNDLSAKFGPLLDTKTLISSAASLFVFKQIDLKLNKIKAKLDNKYGIYDRYLRFSK